MDVSGCKRYWATDYVFVHSEGGSCGASYVLFLLTMTMLSVTRLATMMRRWYLNYIRRQSARGDCCSHWFDVQTVIDGLYAIVAATYVLVLVLIGRNTANSNNGGSYALFSILVYLSCFTHEVGVLELVLFRNRLVKWVKNLEGATDSTDVSRFDRDQSRHYGILVICGVAMLASAATVVAMNILAVSEPNRADVYFRISISLFALVDVAFTAVAVLTGRAYINLVGPLLKSETHAAVAKRRIARTRGSQIANAVFGLCGSTALLLFAFEVIPWRWWTIPLLTAIDTFSAFVAVFRERPRRRKAGERAKVQGAAIEEQQTVDNTITEMQLNPHVSKHMSSPRPQSVKMMRQNSDVLFTENATTGTIKTEIEVGHETLIYYFFGEKGAIKAARVSGDVTFLLCLWVFCYINATAMFCYFALEEECLPESYVFTSMALGVLIFGSMLASRVSIPIFLKLVRTSSSFWLRLVISLVLSISLMDVVGFDSRCFIIAYVFLAVATLLSMDSVIGGSVIYQRMIAGVVVPTPFIVALLLQLDLILKRRDSKIHIISTEKFQYQWSVYQVALDMAYTLCALFTRDAWKAFRYPHQFMYIYSPISVKIVKHTSAATNTESPGNPALREPSSPRRTSQINDEFKVVDGRLVLTENEQFVDRIVMYEEDAYAYLFLGPNWGGRLVNVLKHDACNLAFKSIATCGCVIYALSLTGVTSPESSLFTLITVILSFFSFLKRSHSVLRMLMTRAVFWIDFVFITLPFIAFGIVLGDVRALMCVPAVVALMDTRTQDSRVIFADTRRTSRNRTVGQTVLHYAYMVVSILMGLSAAAIVLCVAFGLVVSTSLDAAIRFREVDPLTNNTSHLEGNAPDGTFASVRLIQFVANALAGYVIYILLEQVRSVTHASGHQAVNMFWLTAPISKKFVKFCSTKEDRAALHRSLTTFNAAELSSLIAKHDAAAPLGTSLRRVGTATGSGLIVSIDIVQTPSKQG